MLHCFAPRRAMAGGAVSFSHLAALLLVLLSLSVTTPVRANQTRVFVDDLGRSVEVPVNPARIAALHDIELTVPLLELGAPVVAYALTTAFGTLDFPTPE